MSIELSKKEIEIILEWQLATLPLSRPESSIPQEEKDLATKLENEYNRLKDGENTDEKTFSRN